MLCCGNPYMTILYAFPLTCSCSVRFWLQLEAAELQQYFSRGCPVPLYIGICWYFLVFCWLLVWKCIKLTWVSGPACIHFSHGLWQPAHPDSSPLISSQLNILWQHISTLKLAREKEFAPGKLTITNQSLSLHPRAPMLQRTRMCSFSWCYSFLEPVFFEVTEIGTTIASAIDAFLYYSDAEICMLLTDVSFCNWNSTPSNSREKYTYNTRKKILHPILW